MSYLESRAAAAGHALSAAGLFVIVLLFPFYWMAITSFKPDDELHRLRDTTIRSGSSIRRFEHIKQAAVRDRTIRTGCWNTMYVAVGATFLSLIASVLAAYAIERLRFSGAQHVGLGDLPRLSGAAVDPVHSAGHRGVPARPVRHRRWR